MYWNGLVYKVKHRLVLRSRTELIYPFRYFPVHPTTMVTKTGSSLPRCFRASILKLYCGDYQNTELKEAFPSIIFHFFSS